MKRVSGVAIHAALALGLGLTCTALSQTGLPRARESKTFVGEMGEKGKTKGDKDTYEFKDGRFHSTACDKWGFAAAPYLAQRAEGKIIFTAETKSKTEGTMTWKLTLDGDNLTGVATWKKGEKAPKEYWIKAALKK